MLFKDQKRELIKLKAKPGVVQLAQDLYQVAYPFADEANLDNLFEELIVRKAIEMQLINVSSFTKAPVQIPENSEITDTLEVSELLGA